MNKQKCIRCERKCDESGLNFAKRTRNIFKPLPFVCRDCNRIHQKFFPDIKTIKLRQKYEKLRKAKKLIKKSIKQLENNTLFQQEKKIYKDKLTKVYRDIGAKIRAKRKKAFIELERDERKSIREFYYDCPEGFHVDHIIPISKGGKHCLSNLQYLKASENRFKSNKISMQVFERHLENEPVSTTWLQRKFRLTFEDAEKVMNELKV